MRRVAVGLFLGFLFLVFASQSSYAEMCGCMGKMEKGSHEKGMPTMRGMHRHGMEMRGAEHRLWRHLRGLGLDEQQKAAIRDIVSRLVKDSIKKRADIQIARIELHDILGKDPVDMKAVEAKLQQIAATQTDLRLSHIKAREEIKAKMTPEQRAKFKENLKRQAKWMHRGRGMTSTDERNEETEPMR
ncbi:MAG: Spy/CpxP family protein refolding chaperone [Thermodesulfovibrionales bacterium]|jgi:Spy/CpxP family protein refolding chaperone